MVTHMQYKMDFSQKITWPSKFHCITRSKNKVLLLLLQHFLVLNICPLSFLLLGSLNCNLEPIFTYYFYEVIHPAFRRSVDAGFRRNWPPPQNVICLLYFILSSYIYVLPISILILKFFLRCHLPLFVV